MNLNSSPSVTLVVTYSVSFCLLSVHNNMKRYKQVNQLKKITLDKDLQRCQNPLRDK